MPSGFSTGPSRTEQADHRGHERHGAGDVPPVADARQPQQGDEHHERNADRQRGGAPGVGDLERRGGDEDLVGRELVGRVDDEQQKGERRAATANTSRKARARGPSMPTMAVMRMCSPRWKAITEPSMASQRNRIAASSSDHTSGLWKT